MFKSKKPEDHFALLLSLFFIIIIFFFRMLFLVNDSADFQEICRTYKASNVFDVIKILGDDVTSRFELEIY